MLYGRSHNSINSWLWKYKFSSTHLSFAIAVAINLCQTNRYSYKFYLFPLCKNKLAEDPGKSWSFGFTMDYFIHRNNDYNIPTVHFAYVVPFNLLLQWFLCLFCLSIASGSFKALLWAPTLPPIIYRNECLAFTVALSKKPMFPPSINLVLLKSIGWDSQIDDIFLMNIFS